jgi:two-component system, OmpR family, sensor histidine kinase BaeS
MRRLRSLATGITSVSLIVAFVAIAVIAAGVLGVSQSTFDRLMVQAGASAQEAQAMFDRGVTTIFLAAVLIAVAISVALAVVLAAWLSRPLRQMARAAERIAGGDYTTRVPGSGPNELASLADSFNRMAQSLAEQEQQRADFIANAAHELRTPLTNLQGYLEALRDGVIAPTPEQFRSLHEEAQRLVRLSRSLEALAVNQRAEGAVRRENVDVAKAIRSAYEFARPAFEAKAIEVDMSLPDGLLARTEPDGLAQVLANLLQNASRYTPEGGSAAIRAWGQRSRVLVAVSNSGDGIPNADLPHVFERFYRVDKSRDAARGGAGIGLAIVKQLVEASGGRVGADSDGRLTRFWFSLPAA